MPNLSLQTDQANAATQQGLQMLRDDLQLTRLVLYSRTDLEGRLKTWVSYPDVFSEAKARAVVSAAIADLGVSGITLLDSN